jgi:hypothetical protein
MNDNSIRREASRLMDNPNVATTVVEPQHKADAAVVQERIVSRAEITMFRSATPGSAASFFDEFFQFIEENVVNECLLLAGSSRALTLSYTDLSDDNSTRSDQNR